MLPQSCYPFMYPVPFVSFPLSFYHLGILAWWVFLCFSLLVSSSVQGPSTRRGDWFAISCSDEASRTELRIPERLLFVLRAARPLQLKFEDAGFVYVTMVWQGQTRQPSIDGRLLCLVEVLVCDFLLSSAKPKITLRSLRGSSVADGSFPNLLLISGASGRLPE